jgi:hypothetical protein
MSGSSREAARVCDGKEDAKRVKGWRLRFYHPIFLHEPRRIIQLFTNVDNATH